MAVIELAKPGQEAITYELIVSVANAALTVTVVLATQLLSPFDSVTCDCATAAHGGQSAKYWRICNATAGDDDYHPSKETQKSWQPERLSQATELLNSACE